jgi:ABC-type phosphate transport system substrate-binding protein
MDAHLGCFSSCQQTSSQEKGKEKRIMMRVKLGRICALTAVCAGAAFAALTPAAYAVGTEKCEGGVTGAGSSLQKVAQQKVFIPGFLATGKGWEALCSSEPSPITYFPSSSGKGLAQWGAGGGGLKEEEIEKTKVFPTYVGTDVGPEGSSEKTGTQLRQMDEAGSQGFAAGEGVVTVPVAQSAVSVLVQIPAACKGTLAEKEVVSISSQKLEQEWRTNTVDWAGLVTGTTTGKSECTTEKAPVLWARSSASGTTAGFKRFLGHLESGTEKASWTTDIENAANSESASKWPTLPTETACSVSLEKGSQLAEAVFGCEAANGAIGYADLTDALKAGFEKEAKLIKPAGKTYYVAVVRVSNAAFGTASSFVSPEKGGASNCKKAEYLGQATLAVKGNESWSGASQEKLEKSEAEAYPICTLTFDLAWHEYEKVKDPGGSYTEQKTNTVFAFFKYIVEGGQTGLAAEHYGALPANVDTAAKTGLETLTPTTRAIRWK